MLTQISLVSKDDAQAGRFFSDLHADPAINRLIEKAGWTEAIIPGRRRVTSPRCTRSVWTM